MRVIILHKKLAITPALLIAKSVITKKLTQSYVASGFPQWLSSFFVQEGPGVWVYSLFDVLVLSCYEWKGLNFSEKENKYWNTLK